MKNRLLRWMSNHPLSAILIAGVLLLPVAGKAATVTTLLSEDFSGATFPPSGWSASHVQSENSYTFSNYGYFYRSNYGKGGANGSAVCWNYYSEYATTTLNTPTMDASSFASSNDSTFLDFDLWAPYTYYAYYNGSFALKINVNGTTLQAISSSSGWTFPQYSNYYNFTDPRNYGYYQNQYWRHYHVFIPAALRTSSMQVQFSLYEQNPGYYWNRSGDMAFDNVVVSDTRLDVLTLLGPPSLNFGAVPYLQTALPIYTRFVNNSTRAFTLSNYAIGGTDPGDFTIVYAPTSVAVGAEDSVGVSYTPQASGERSAVLSFSTNADVPASVSIPLNGYGLRPYISLPPFLPALFSRVHVRFADTAYATLMVSNTGQVPLHISPASSIDGDYPQMYSIVRMPPTIGPDQTDSIIVAFAPTVEGLMDANLNIVSDADNGTQVMPLKGIGILARLDVDSSYRNATTLNFDSVAVGAESCFQITLFNPGSDTLAIEKNFFSSADYDFSMTPLTGTDTLIAPQTSKAIEVCFKPLKRGYRTAELRIVTNIPLTYGTPRFDTSQFTVLFMGTGVPTGNFQITGPENVDSIALGKTLCQTDTLWNTGEADLTVTSLTVAGANATEFMPNPPALPFVLAAGTNQTFTVCATPAAINDQLATLAGVATSGEKLDTATLPLDVYGLSESDSMFLSIPFDFTCVPDTNMQIVQVYNTGNVTETYTASISGPNAADFTLGSEKQIPLSHGQETSFQVYFHPSTNGVETATFTITNGGGGSITLTATGGEAAIAGNGTAPATQVGSTNSFTATIHNTGTCDWTPGIPTLPANSMFSYVSGGTTTIAPNGTGTLAFTFAPTVEGTFSDPVSFPAAVGASSSTTVTLDGTSQASGVADVSSSQGYSLEQNYPNPFGGKSDVELTLPTSGRVQLAIVDVTGKVVQTVLDQRMSAGTFDVTMDASGLVSGTYYYQLTASGVTLTRQMTVVK